MLELRDRARNLASLFLLLNASISIGSCEGKLSSVGDPSQRPEEGCLSQSEFFARDVYANVLQGHCIGCHSPGGLAKDSRMVFNTGALDQDYLQKNEELFARIARERFEGESLVVVKARGDAAHPGGVVVRSGTPEAEILSEFVRRIDSPTNCQSASEQDYFHGLVYRDPLSLLRKTTLSLVGRLPTEAEKNAVRQGGEAALRPLVDAMFGEPAFSDRLEESWNDLFRVVDEAVLYGYGGELDPTVFPNAQWYDSLPEAEKQIGRRRVSEAIAREPLELVSHIVSLNRPITDILTADYTMVNPFTARSYGVLDRVSFADMNDENEFKPVTFEKVGAYEVGGQTFPHAGALTTYSFLRRYPTSATNRNRGRARIFFSYFLDIDLLELAPRADPLAALGFSNPVHEAPQCTVCHATVDAMAGAFQNHNERGRFAPRQDGWYSDSFAPGFAGEALPSSQQYSSLRWFGQQAIKSPNFVNAMVSQAYRMMIGREPLRAPSGVAATDFLPRFRAYQAQRRILQQLGTDFVAANYNFKSLIQGMIATPFYRAANIDPNTVTPSREAELMLLSSSRLLTPEALARKIHAIFGFTWKLNQTDALRDIRSGYRILFGGHDSMEVIERLTEPNALMASLHQAMSNEITCRNVPQDFAKTKSTRRFFANVDPADLPTDPAGREKIIGTIIHLHELILGEELIAESPHIQGTLKLFEDLRTQGKAEMAAGTADADVTGWCTADGPRQLDPEYTVRAWMGVVTYLVSTHQFLYE